MATQSKSGNSRSSSRSSGSSTTTKKQSSGSQSSSNKLAQRVADDLDNGRISIERAVSASLKIQGGASADDIYPSESKQAQQDNG